MRARNQIDDGDDCAEVEFWKHRQRTLASESAVKSSMDSQRATVKRFPLAILEGLVTDRDQVGPRLIDCQSFYDHFNSVNNFQRNDRSPRGA